MDETAACHLQATHTMPGEKATGSKRKAQGDSSREAAAAAAGSRGLVFMIQCTRDSGIDEYDDDI
jgi:hypothetical protein